MSIKNPTLVHFRHFKHFSSLLTNLPSTTVESVLQNHLFLQNKANFPDAQMNVNSILTKDYVNKSNWKVRKNKANTKPNKANQSQFKPIKCQNKPKTNPIKPNFKGKKMLPRMTINGRKIVQGEKLNCITYS